MKLFLWVELNFKFNCKYCQFVLGMFITKFLILLDLNNQRIGYMLHKKGLHWWGKPYKKIETLNHRLLIKLQSSIHLFYETLNSEYIFVTQLITSIVDNNKLYICCWKIFLFVKKVHSSTANFHYKWSNIKNILLW